MFKAEKEQASGMVSIFYGIGIAFGVGAVFMLLFPEIAGMIGDSIKAKFTELIATVVHVIPTYLG